MTLIERIHSVHEKRGIVDLTCLLCREAQEKHAAWVKRLAQNARVFEPRPAA